MSVLKKSSRRGYLPLEGLNADIRVFVKFVFMDSGSHFDLVLRGKIFTSCSPFIPSVIPLRSPIKLLLISLSEFFSLFLSLSTLSRPESRRGTRDTEGGPTDKTRVVNSSRRKPTHLSLSTARLPARLASS